MTAWLEAHAASVYSFALVGGFAGVALWESWRPLRVASAPLAQRWRVNIALLAVNQFAGNVLMPLVGFTAAMWASANGAGLLPRIGLPGWAAVLASVLALDFTRWALHAAWHRTATGWRLHRVHHSDIDYDCTLSLRFHPLEALITQGVVVVVVIACGLPPLGVVVSDVVTIVLGYWAHGNVALPETWERRLSRVLVTPAIHRVHHSTRLDESGSNFGAVLSIWDRLFATYRASAAGGALGMAIGLREERDPGRLGLGALLVMPFVSPRIGAQASPSPPETL